jgi:hypothetical protein
MSRYKDLTGQKFGELTVIGLSDKLDGRCRMWDCLCSCGNTKTVSGVSLTHGRTKTCGAPIHRLKDIVGQKFGEFTVISYYGPLKYKGKTTSSLYLCRCSCGKECIVPRSALISGSRISCGHVRRVQDSDYIGHKFGKLSPIKRVSDKPIIYECLCDCGNTITVRQSGLRTGKSVSCGCETRKKIGLANRKSNLIKTVDDYAEIHDSNGNIALIDLEDVEKVKKFCWYMAPTGYFYARTGPKFVSTEYVSLHRFLFDLTSDDEVMVDHVNGDIKDNRHKNLRICSPLENVWNGKLKKNNKTGVPGVSIVNGKYVVNAINDGKRYCLGTFTNIQDAADVRYKFEVEHRGGFARLTWYDQFKKEGDENIGTR